MSRRFPAPPKFFGAKSSQQYLNQMHSQSIINAEVTGLDPIEPNTTAHAELAVSCPKATAATPHLKSISFMDLASPDKLSQAANNLLGDGFLRRGQTGLINGPTGIGKSVLVAQMAFCWAVGRPFFGIVPQGPLRVMIAQSENDAIDLAEMRDGILAEMSFSAAELALVHANIRIMRSYEVGAAFLLDLKHDVVTCKPDLLLVDPLFAYAGVDLAKDQPGLTKFLRGQLLPFSITHNLGVIFVHHTNKPPAAASKSVQTAGDFAYSGSGHNELSNFARFVIYIRSVGSRTVYEFQLGKRGKRAKLIDDGGEPIYHFLIKHADQGIHWEKATEAELAASLSKTRQTLKIANSSAKAGKSDLFVATFEAVQKDNQAPLKQFAERYQSSEKTVRRLFDDNKRLSVGPNRFQLGNGIITRVSEDTEADLDLSPEVAA